MRAFFHEGAQNSSASPPRGDASYAEWHQWSVREPAAFWAAMWRFANVVGEREADAATLAGVVRGVDRMAPPDPVLGPVWFEGARLNFTENLLRHSGETPAIIARSEDNERRVISFDELRAEAARVAAALHTHGIKPGDRIAGYLPNVPETVIAMLGAAWIGAVWSSCSPDFGVEGVCDRFGQIEPRILIAADGYRYAGKEIDCCARIAAIASAIPSIERVVLVPFLRRAPDVSALTRTTLWKDWLSGNSSQGVPFVRLPFNHPLYVMYSSGTTGLPKCMVHGAGGTLIQHLKEHMLHVDLRAGERIFYFTTCGWMMWNWLVSALACGATLVLYDGAPIRVGKSGLLWDLAADERISVFGTSAKYLAMSEKAELSPVTTHDLGALRAILSTGSPLAPTSYDYVETKIKPGVQLASISGGTDIISCFALGNPLEPVHRGELQGPGLGMAVDVFDERGTPIRGVAGELVCTRPFPSMPIRFWNDPDGSKYRQAYFDFFPGVWRHGDWAAITSTGGLVIYGRSDATLNPGGVRIGTAEIYRQVEQIPDVLESVVIGQDVHTAEGDDVRVVLFVRLRDDRRLDRALEGAIKRRIREGASPHHVPKLMLQVSDIPRTISGKITELAVREAFLGRPVSNTAAMANPQALDEFRRLGEVHRA